MACWLCRELLPDGCGTAVGTPMSFSKISAGHLVVNLGLKSADEFQEDGEMCGTCAALIFKVDVVTYELDRYIEQLQLRGGVDSKAFVRRITADGVAPGVSFRDEGVQTEEPASRPAKGLDVRIILRRITVEDVAENTKGNSSNRSEILDHLSIQNPSAADVAQVNEGVHPDSCSDGEADAMDCVDVDSVASGEPFDVGTPVEEFPSDVALPPAAFPREKAEVCSARRDEVPRGQTETVPCAMPCELLGKLADVTPPTPTDWVAGENTTNSVIPAPNSERGENDDPEVERSPQDSTVDVGLLDENRGEDSDEEGQNLPKKKIVWPRIRKRNPRKFGDLGDLTKTSITREDFDIRENCFGCKQCSYTCRTTVGVESHINRVHRKVTPYTCTECGKTFAAWAFLKEHLTRHKGKPNSGYLCNCCGKIFKTSQAFRGHQALVEKRKANVKEKDKCDVCGVTVRNLRHHKRIQHPKVKPQCKECGEIVTTKAQLGRHAAQVHGVRKTSYAFFCKKCDGAFSNLIILHRHRLKVHGETLDAEKGECFPCALCPRMFLDRYRWEDHMNYHNGLNPFQCPLCEYATWGRVMLNQHTRARHGCSRRKAHIQADEEADSSLNPEAADEEESVDGINDS